MSDLMIDDRVRDKFDTGTVVEFDFDGRPIVKWDHPVNDEGPMVAEPETLERAG